MWMDIQNAREELEMKQATWSDAQEVCLLPSKHIAGSLLGPEGLSFHIEPPEGSITVLLFRGRLVLVFSSPRPVLSKVFLSFWHGRTWLVLVVPNALAHKKLLAWCEAATLEWRDKTFQIHSLSLPPPDTARAAGCLSQSGVSLCPFSERPWESSNSK